MIEKIVCKLSLFIQKHYFQRFVHVELIYPFIYLFFFYLFIFTFAIVAFCFEEFQLVLKEMILESNESKM